MHNPENHPPMPVPSFLNRHTDGGDYNRIAATWIKVSILYFSKNRAASNEGDFHEKEEKIEWN